MVTEKEILSGIRPVRPSDSLQQRNQQDLLRKRAVARATWVSEECLERIKAEIAQVEEFEKISSGIHRAKAKDRKTIEVLILKAEQESAVAQSHDPAAADREEVERMLRLLRQRQDNH